jgi:glyoxylase-like metal-dependent hydrolase (beta-lactamase superfamily II)
MPPFQITLPTPFPIGPVNVYLLEGDPLTLIDCGPKNPDSLKALESGLLERGLRLEDIRRLVLTHHHVDHVGLARTIVDRSGAAVLTHPYNLPYLADYEAERARSLPFYAEIWTESGVPAEIVDLMRQAGEGISRWLDPVPAAVTIDEGQVVGLGGADWRVYHTPGHAGGLVCLLNPETKELIANDHLLRDISSNPVLEPPPTGPAVMAGHGRAGTMEDPPTGSAGAPRPKRLVEYLHHMRRVADLHPAVAYTGHGETVHDVAALVGKRLAFHRRRADKIYDSLQGRSLTLWELTGPLFGERLKRGMDYFLAHSEVLGHLDILLDEGKVQAVREGALVRWRVA